MKSSVTNVLSWVLAVAFGIILFAALMVGIGALNRVTDNSIRSNLLKPVEGVEQVDGQRVGIAGSVSIYEWTEPKSKHRILVFQYGHGISTIDLGP